VGGIRKPRKKYLEGKPKKLWNAELLRQELELVGEYGLRNKRELWLARAILKKIVRRARAMLAMRPEEREKVEKPFKERLYRMGFIDDPDAPLDSILSLDVRAILERRLQTLVYRLGYARTIYQARQLIVHGHVEVNGVRIRSPGYLVPRGLEQSIRVRIPVPGVSQEAPSS